jgi:hypothetical protein
MFSLVRAFKINVHTIFAFLLFSSIILFYFSEYFNKLYYSYQLNESANENQLYATISRNFTLFNSKCLCKKSIILRETKAEYLVYVNESNTISYNNPLRLIYKTNKSLLEQSRFACDIYNVLYRGPNSNIISYSLYGNNEIYSRYLGLIVQRVKSVYSDWIVRIYHDGYLNDSFICKHECANNNSTDEIYDNVEFCDVNKLAFGLKKDWNASYIQGRFWRFIPIGDIFVDYFMSRDTESMIIDREVDSVKVWLQSNTLLHVMRGIISIQYKNLFLFISLLFFISLAHFVN